MKSLEVRTKATRLYKDNLTALLHSSKRYIVNEGGSRSGKSYSIMQVLITQCLNEPNLHVTVCSHSLPHLKRGAMRDFDIIIKEIGYYFEAWHNKTDNVYRLPNGSEIEFFGLEDADKARGAGRDILFINESNLVSKPVFDQLDMRTRRKVILDLNPSDFDSWCYDVADGNDAVRIVSNYLDNPFLQDYQIRVIESYKDADPLMWEVFGLGLRGKSQEQIYTHWRLTDRIPEGEVIYGLDFGYRNPTALVKVTIHDGAIYAEELLYKSNLTTNDLIAELPQYGISGYSEIFADCAEPKTIEELYRAGYNAKQSDKDVYAGIMKVKAYPLFIKKDSANLISELKTYKWKTDKDGNVIDKEPTKLNDHALDALRYAVYTKLKQPTLSWGVI